MFLKFINSINGKIRYIDITFTNPEFVELCDGAYSFQYDIKNTPELVGKTIISIFFFQWSMIKGVISVGLDRNMSSINILKNTIDTPSYIKVRVVYMN